MNSDYFRQKALMSVNATLRNQSEALENLNFQYQTCQFSQDQLLSSIDILFNTITAGAGGKIVFCGIGKSHKIATKLLATLNSLSIHSCVLHPSEALHGDLGLLRDNDCIIFLTASGSTPELIQLLPHISKSIPIILLTCNKDSKLAKHPQVKSLIYAELPSHLKEERIHGIPAPTVSATLSLALADATSLALAELIETDLLKRKKLFSMKHPGGSIGSDLSHLNDNIMQKSDILDNPSINSKCSSLLSLNNVRQLLQQSETMKGSGSTSTNSSLTSSDDEDTLANYKIPIIDKKLSMKIKNCESYQLLKMTHDEFLSISEIDFFKSISLYDYIIYSKPSRPVSAHFALESTIIRHILKLEIGHGYTEEVWKKFIHNLSNDFKQIHI